MTTTTKGWNLGIPTDYNAGFSRYGDGDLYYHPEKIPCEIVGSTDDGGSWEFEILLVVKLDDGTLWGFYDSGCSCPTPFSMSDGFTPDDVREQGRPITSVQDLEAFAASDEGYDKMPISQKTTDYLALAGKVRELTKGA